MARRFWPRRRPEGARPPTPTGTSGGRLSSITAIPGGAATPEEHRFAQVYAADRVGPMPYPNQPTPDVSAARGRVRSLVEGMLDGVDEGSGRALDPLIASIASGWLARVDSQHADHHAVIDRLVGGARQQLAEAEAAHERDRRALEIARRDYAEARERLGEPVDDGSPAAPPAAPPTAPSAAPSTVPPADPPTGPLPREDRR
ncbi:hypothetical protein PHK61_20630 [Actinomycetospora lutea]|uniref:hypothetical protein n=1 Tax=Actinomycetospora lutea TaxID=663604 RepID=UPI00236657DF|nr:hypothetical protein [Actinomycetospora lutea]MDD7940832.1 hypothetical protein [Actinomycetospora lutea]